MSTAHYQIVNIFFLKMQKNEIPFTQKRCGFFVGTINLRRRINQSINRYSVTEKNYEKRTKQNTKLLEI